MNVDEPLPGNVELMPLPSSIVSIVPEYRGYDYVVVRDEIVIVQPSTRKVVEVIHRGSETNAMREGGGHGHRLTLGLQHAGFAVDDASIFEPLYAKHDNRFLRLAEA